MKSWIVIRINKDPKETYAAESYTRAFELANIDPGDRIEWTTVEAKDAGAARLRGKNWKLVDEDYSGGDHWAMNSSEEAYEYEEMIGSMARTLFVMAWADKEEEEGNSHSGEDLMEAAPETPSKATELAYALFEKIEQLNGVAMWELLERAEQADIVGIVGAPKSRRNHKPDQEEFGYCLAMMALGTGVSWFDDHKKFKIKIPNIEVHLNSDTLYWSGVAIQNPSDDELGHEDTSTKEYKRWKAAMQRSTKKVDDKRTFAGENVKYLVHTGRPSWHQRRAGHISSGVSVFKTSAEAIKYLENFKKHHPDEPASIQKVQEI